MLHIPIKAISEKNEKIFSAIFIERKEIAELAEEFTFQLEKPFQFNVGQYVWLELNELLLADPAGSRRAFSIVSIPNEKNTIAVACRFSNSGYKQSLFALKKGAKVTIHGPFGSSFSLPESQPMPEHLIMVAGGIGIAPFLPNIKNILAKNPSTKCTLVYLNRTEIAAPYLKEMRDLMKKDKHFKLIPHFGEPDSKIFNELVHDINAPWWICGTQGMVDWTYKCLNEQGVSILKLYFEQFYPVIAHQLTEKAFQPESGENFESIILQALDSASNHVIITDRNGFILFANQAAQQITGFNFSEMKGNTPRIWGGLMDNETYREFWKKKAAGEYINAEFKNRRKNGEIYYALAHISPIIEGKEIVGFIGTEEDITELRRIQTQLHETEQRWNYALDGSGTGVWDWNFEEGKIFYSKRWKAILGYDEDEITDEYTEWEKRVHPDDLQCLKDEIEKHCHGKSQSFECEHRILCKDGSWKWVVARGKVMKWSKDGKALQMIGTYEDISLRKQYVEELKKRTDQLDKMNKFLVGRELTMSKLKEEIKKLEEKLKGKTLTDNQQNNE